MSNPPPSDTFTRFTSTSPHASSKPPTPPTSTSSSFAYQPPTPRSTPSSSTSSQNETPKEKVARLRAAARAAKAQQSMSRLDRMIDRGRTWADNAHRIFAYGLIGFAGLSTVVAFYGLTSLVTHNRRQKRAWIEREMQRLTDAQSAFLSGTATPEQLHLLEQERAGEEMLKIRERDKQLKKERSLWNRMKNAMGMTGGDKGREDAATWRGGEVRREIEAGERKGGSGKVRLLEEGWVDESAMSGESVTDAVKRLEESRRSGEKQLEATGRRGGMLDQLAGNVAEAVTPKGEVQWPNRVRHGSAKGR